MRKVRGNRLRRKARKSGTIAPSVLISLREMSRKLARAASRVHLSLPDLHTILNLVARVKHNDVAFFEAVKNLRLEPILATNFYHRLTRDVIHDSEHGRIRTDPK